MPTRLARAAAAAGVLRSGGVSLLALGAFALSAPATVQAQVSTPATPRVGSPTTPQLAGPPAPLPSNEALPVLVPREGPLPSNLTLEQALEEAEARSPAILAARAAVDAARGRLRQAGFRTNPELSVEVENFAGTGDLSGVRGLETTVALNQRLDLGGRRQARQAVAQAELTATQLRLDVARADLAQSVRQQFATAVTARERLRLAQANEKRAQELARISNTLVDAGREPPLRGLRARSAAAQAVAELLSAEAAETASRATLSSLFGVSTPPESVTGQLLDLVPRSIDAEQSLEVRLAEAERLGAEAALRQEIVARKLDPAVGLGVRHVRERGDFALVAGLSLPLPVFDKNRGNIEAAQANVRAAEARRAAAVATATVRVRNAITNVEAAAVRVEALERAAVPEAAEALRLAQLSYQSGKTSLLELLDAQNAFSSAQAALIDARLAQALATAELGRVAAQ
ncbi:TolC family protein [Sphingomonas parva]|uniref:TolC family protein n=1 Tax=Sphingomonas parva TaxID=2555898 RepID=A0A4Y8ZUU7_9SPHN|nr:TolC family protein [Sphingomonas parva]TFI59788.1 TolC family protein [Sphingomonas parva]